MGTASRRLAGNATQRETMRFRLLLEDSSPQKVRRNVARPLELGVSIIVVPAVDAWLAADVIRSGFASQHPFHHQ